MALIWDALIEILRKPTIIDVFTELMLFCGPLWAAVLVGLVVGWVWKPKWAVGLGGNESETDKLGASQLSSSSSSSSSSLSLEGLLGLNLGLPTLQSIKAQLPSCITCLMSDQSHEKEDGCAVMERESEAAAGSVKLPVRTADLDHLSQLVDVTDGGPEWIHMMDRFLPTFSYDACRRDPVSGPPQYRSRTVFEDATPETVRDFFWDDEFRMSNKWDDMLLLHDILEECPTTGTLVLHWIRKFPLFCSDREYTIGRRIWNADGAYYCVTKGVPYPSLPRRSKPRRVDEYYSSWCIRAAESRRGGMTACEVILFHHENMGIPWELAKLGVRQGMWGTVKKIEPGLRAYQMSREAGEALSRYAIMAGINTNVSTSYLKQLRANTSSTDSDVSDDDCENEEDTQGRHLGKNIPRFLVVGGAVALACTLDRGLLTKALIFGVARKFAKVRR